MGSVYQKAVRTFIWLGPSTLGLEHALGSLAKLTKHELTREALLQDGNCIHDIFVRAWFFRLRTLEEVVLSLRRTILLGQANCKLEVLFDL